MNGGLAWIERRFFSLPHFSPSLCLCVSVPLWLISAIENFITNYRMRTTASSENLNKRALDPIALFVTRPEPKSTFDSKITSVMKVSLSCVA